MGLAAGAPLSQARGSGSCSRSRGGARGAGRRWAVGGGRWSLLGERAPPGQTRWADALACSPSAVSSGARCQCV